MLTDHQNTVRDLANAVGVVTHRSYNTFGVKTDETANAVDCIFGYTGKLFDEVTELQNNVNRWYNPTLGKWLCEDPIGFNAGDANIYRYVRNNAIQFSDPLGLVQNKGGIVRRIPYEKSVNSDIVATSHEGAVYGPFLPLSFVVSICHEVCSPIPHFRWPSDMFNPQDQYTPLSPGEMALYPELFEIDGQGSIYPMPVHPENYQENGTSFFDKLGKLPTVNGWQFRLTGSVKGKPPYINKLGIEATKRW